MCNEQADAFVLPMLLHAAVTKQDISVEAAISERLMHNLRYGVLYALDKMVEKSSWQTSLKIVNRPV